jgi:hypothetical protein
MVTFCEHKEVDVFHPAAIVVMAVDNLWLPKMLERFGTMFMEYVIPSLMIKDGIFLARSQND